MHAYVVDIVYLYYYLGLAFYCLDHDRLKKMDFEWILPKLSTNYAFSLKKNEVSTDKYEINAKKENKLWI